MRIFLLLLIVCAAPLFAASDDAVVLDLARKTIEKARYATFVTVDEAGQPRTRIVDPFLPDAKFVIYVATKPNTRKVQQIKTHAQVTLFYFDKADRNYVSVMGQAELLTDTATKLKMRRDADSDRIYPNFPDDYVLIKITPKWIEGLLPGYRGDPDNWRPTSVQME